MKMHGVEAPAMEAGGTQEVWTVPGPWASWEFCFGKEDDSISPIYFWKIFFSFDGHCTKKKSADAFALWQLERSRTPTRVGVSVCAFISDCLLFPGVHLHVGMTVFTHCITYQSSTPEISPGALIFFPYWPFLACKRPTLLVSDCFYGFCYTEYSPTLPLLPFARIKFRKKIIFMRVRGVGINGWIIFRKRRTSSLRWAVSHSNVLVITQHIMPGKRLLVCCSAHAIYWLD